MPISDNPVIKLSSNTNGHDYVIGDLHGCYDLLEKLLERVNFDTRYDRLFSVGDIVDRGESSFKCLQLLSKPWFYAVRGNHEQLMLTFFEDYLVSRYIDAFAFDEEEDDSHFLANGGEWVEMYFHSKTSKMIKAFDTLLKRVEKLPYILIVGENNNRFNIVHADLLRPKDSSVELSLWTDNDLDKWHEASVIVDDYKPSLLWSRLLMGSGSKVIDTPFYDGLSTTYCGHTISKYDGELRRVLSHVCLDHGAYRSVNNSNYCLTMINANTQEVHVVS